MCDIVTRIFGVVQVERVNIFEYNKMLNYNKC